MKEALKEQSLKNKFSFPFVLLLKDQQGVAYMHLNLKSQSKGGKVRDMSEGDAQTAGTAKSLQGNNLWPVVWSKSLLWKVKLQSHLVIIIFAFFFQLAQVC